MENFIKRINNDLQNCTNYHEMVRYFMVQENELSNLFKIICSYQLNLQMDGLSETLLKGIYNQEISDKDTKILENVVSLLTNNFLKARIYHILFLKRKNIRTFI